MAKYKKGDILYYPYSIDSNGARILTIKNIDNIYYVYDFYSLRSKRVTSPYNCFPISVLDKMTRLKLVNEKLARILYS